VAKNIPLIAKFKMIEFALSKLNNKKLEKN
jgi:hypothetical protein